MKVSIPTLAVGLLAVVSWIDGGWASRIATLAALAVCVAVDVRRARRES
jgi:hypothetical protein